MNNLNYEDLIPNIILDDINLNNRNTYKSQLTILTIKSLFPMEETVGNRIDYKRFTEELKLWINYRVGEDISLLNTLKTPVKSEYLSYYDDTYYTRLIPIIVANKDSKIIEDEVIKNILYFSGSVENLLEWLLIGLFIHLLINNVDDIIDILKEYIINFSQIDFMDKYKENFRIGIDNIPNTYKITFEKERISLLGILNGEKSSKYINLQDLLLIIGGNGPSTTIGKIVDNSCNPLNYNCINDFYINMNKYILNLRKGRIDLEDLKIKEYILPDVFCFKEGDMFFHSLLNYCKVIKKEVKAGCLTSLISTKSGNYLFKRDPS
ncbi:MAG: hypothetical protein RIN55_05955 [Tissierellaceae bacterium]|nr:hypothetical protein [Tissierellaceae bacterium]